MVSGHKWLPTTVTFIIIISFLFNMYGIRYYNGNPQSDVTGVKSLHGAPWGLSGFGAERFISTYPAVTLPSSTARLYSYRLTATASISHRTPLGSSFTATQLLAGLEVKYLAYTWLKSAKSAISAKKQVVLNTCSSPVPAAVRMASTFLQLCSAWALIPSGTSPVWGLTGI